MKKYRTITGLQLEFLNNHECILVDTLNGTFELSEKSMMLTEREKERETAFSEMLFLNMAIININIILRNMKYEKTLS